MTVLGPETHWQLVSGGGEVLRAEVFEIDLVDEGPGLAASLRVGCHVVVKRDVRKLQMRGRNRVCVHIGENTGVRVVCTFGRRKDGRRTKARKVSLHRGSSV